MKPRSSADETSGVRYFPRMLDKIRLHSKGQLEPDYHPNLGAGADGRLTKFLRISYDDLRQRVGQGGTDEEILEWCFTNGRRLDENDREIWNGFISKLGWNDFGSDYLVKAKDTCGLSHRDDIVTFSQLIEVDEGRQP
jgi:gluconokinase